MKKLVIRPTIQGPRAQTTGSSHFDPDSFFDLWGNEAKSLLPQGNDLRSSIIAAFDLAPSDNYVYHALASVTLGQVQEAIKHGGEHGLHNWYSDSSGAASNLPLPSPADIYAYTSVFASTTSTSKSLVALAANAKKNSHRALVAPYLQSKRRIPSSCTAPKLKKAHINPYYDYWVWSCQNLEWAGPTEDTVHVKQSHHILPVMMHHFGCTVPSHESLEVIRYSARGRKVIDLGCGNGYWTYMLRRLGVQVDAVDNLQSRYRTLWISDMIVEDGEKYLRSSNGAKDRLLLLVYPIVGADFTAKVLKFYAGDTVCVVGTQNRNGYTAFSDKMIDEYMATERPDFTKTLQIPLPSFAGKDEALFVFEKGGRME
ncbi:MAG: hypothetical protein Q9219_004334 [cf. Caloplaca sp. 3 TL-2023]